MALLLNHTAWVVSKVAPNNLDRKCHSLRSERIQALNHGPNLDHDFQSLNKLSVCVREQSTQRIYAEACQTDAFRKNEDLRQDIYFQYARLLLA